MDKSDKPKSPIDSKISHIKPTTSEDSKDEFESKKPKVIDLKPSMPSLFSDLSESLDKLDKPKSPLDSKTSPIKPTTGEDSEDEFESKKPKAIELKPSMPSQFSDLPESLDKSDKPKSPLDSKTSPIKPTTGEDSEDEFKLKKPTGIDSKSLMSPQDIDLPESLDKSDKPKSPPDSKTSTIKPTASEDSKDEFELKKPKAIDSKPSMPSQFSDLPESLDKLDKPKAPLDSKTSPIKPTTAEDSEDEFELKKPTSIGAKHSMSPQVFDLPESLDKLDKPKSPLDSKTSPIKPIASEDSEDEFESKKPKAIDLKPTMPSQFSDLSESLDKLDKPKSPLESKTSPIKPTTGEDSEDEFKLKKPTSIDAKHSMSSQVFYLPESLDKLDKPKSPLDSKTSPIKPTTSEDSEDEFELKKPKSIDAKYSISPQVCDLPESLDKSDKPKSPLDSKISPIKPTTGEDSEDKFKLKEPIGIDAKHSMSPQDFYLPQSVDKSDKPKSPLDSKASPIKHTNSDDSKDEFELKEPAGIDSMPLISPQVFDLAQSLDKLDKPKSPSDSDKPKYPLDSKTSPIKPIASEDSEDEFESKKPKAIDSKTSMPSQFSDLPESIDKSDKTKSLLDSKTSPIKPIASEDSEDEFESKKPKALELKPSMPSQFSDLPESLDKSDKPKFPLDSKTSPIKPTTGEDSEDEIELKKPTSIDAKRSMSPQVLDLPESLDKLDKPKSPLDSKTSPIKSITVEDSEDEIELKKPKAIDSKTSMPSQFSDLPESIDKSDKPKSPLDSKTSPIKPTASEDSEDEFESKKPKAIELKPSMPSQFSDLPESLDKSDKPKSPSYSKTSPIKPTTGEDSEDEFKLQKPTGIDAKHSMSPQVIDLTESLDKSDKPKSPLDSKASPIKHTNSDDSKDEFESKKPAGIDSKPLISPQVYNLPVSLDKSDKPKSPLDSKTSPIKPSTGEDSEDEFELKKPTSIDAKHSMSPQVFDLPESLDKLDKPKSPLDSKTSPIKTTTSEYSEDEFELKKLNAIDAKHSMSPQDFDLPQSVDKSDKPKSSSDSKTSPIKSITVEGSEDEFELKKLKAIDSKLSMPSQFSDLPESIAKLDKPRSPLDSKTSPIKPTASEDSEDEFESRKPRAIELKPSMPSQFSDLPESLDKSDKPKSPLDSKTSPIKPTTGEDSEDEFELKKPTSIDAKHSMSPQVFDLPESLDKLDKPKSPLDSKTSPIKSITVEASEDEFELKKPKSIDSKTSMPSQFSDLPESIDKSDKRKSPLDSKTSPIKSIASEDSEDEFESKKPKAIDLNPSMTSQFSDLPESPDKSDKPKSPLDSKTSPTKPTTGEDFEDKFELKKPTSIDKKHSMSPQVFDLLETLDKLDKPKSPLDSKTSPTKSSTVEDSEDEFELKKPTAVDSKPSMSPQFTDLPVSLDKSDKQTSPPDSKTSPNKPTTCEDSEDEFELKKPTGIDLNPSMSPQVIDLTEYLDKSDKAKSPLDSKTSPNKPTTSEDSKDEFELEKPISIDSKSSMSPQDFDLPESLDKSDKPKSPLDSKTSPIKLTTVKDSKDEFEIKKPTGIDSKPSVSLQVIDLPESVGKSDKQKSPLDSKTSPIKSSTIEDSEYEFILKKQTASDTKPTMPSQFSDLPESLDKSDKPKSPLDSKTSPIKPTTSEDSEDEFELQKLTAIDSKPSIPSQFSDLSESLDKSDKQKHPLDSKTSPIKSSIVEDSEDEFELKKPTVIDSKPSMPSQFSGLPESLDKSDKPKSSLDSKTSPTTGEDSEDEFEIKKPTGIDSKPLVSLQVIDLPESLDKSDKQKSPLDSKTSPIKSSTVEDSEYEFKLKKPTAIDSKPTMPSQFSDLPESLDKLDKPKSLLDSESSPIKSSTDEDPEEEIDLKKPTSIDSKPSQFSDFKPTTGEDFEKKHEIKKPTSIDSKPSIAPQYSDLPESLDKSEKSKSLLDSESPPIKSTTGEDPEDEIDIKKPTTIDSKSSMPPQFSELPESLHKSNKPKSPIDSKTSPVKHTSKDSDDLPEYLKPKPENIRNSPLDSNKSLELPNRALRPYSDDETEDEVDGNLPVWRSPEQSLDKFVSVLSRIASESDKSNGSKSISPSSVKPYSDDDSEDEICVEVRTRYRPKNRLSPLMGTSVSSSEVLPPSKVLNSPLKQYSDDESEDEILINNSNSSRPIYRNNYHMDVKYISQKPTSPTILPKSPLKPYSDEESGDEMESDNIIKYSDRKSLNDVESSDVIISTSTTTKPVDNYSLVYSTSPVDFYRPSSNTSKLPQKPYSGDVSVADDLEKTLTSLSPKHPKDISIETSVEVHKDFDATQISIKDNESISSPTLFSTVDNVFESVKFSNTDKTNSRAVAYFVDLDEGDISKPHHSIPNIHKKQNYDKKLKTSKPKLDMKSSVKPREVPITSNKTYSKRTSISETSPKIQKSTTQTSSREKKTIQRISQRNNMESSVTNLKPRKDVKKIVVNDYERIISDKTKISALNNQIRLERTLSPQTNQSFSENVESTSRSTTSRPRIRTDITRVPQQQTLRTFSPPPNRPKPDYSSITSTYAYTRKTQKTAKSVVRKQTDHSPSSRSSTPNDDSQRRRLRTPTVPIGEHHYMQPTIAHSRRYGNLKSADSELSLDEKFSKSPVPQVTAITNKNTFQSKQTKPQSGTRKMQTNKINSNSRESLKSSETKTKISIERMKSTTDTKQKSTTKRVRNLYTKDNSLKSTIDKSDSLTKSAIIEQVSNVRYNRQVSKEKAVDKKKIVSKSTAKKEDSKLSSEDTNRLKDRDVSATNQKRITNASSKVPIRTKTNSVTDDKVNKLELKAKVDQKQSTVKRNITKKIDTPKDKLVQSKSIDLKVQKKLKNTLNNQAGSTPKSSPTMSHSSYSSRKSTSATTTTTSKNSQSTNKIEKELLNSKLAERKSFTTTVTSSGTNRISTVKLHREPIATTLVSTVVITDDNDSENNTRSVRSNDSTKSSSSSGSRKVITSEVFTKTFGPDKPFEVIYRQPEVDYMSIMRPQSVEQRCVNEYDVSFIDTTDSSLSDSVALPTFTSDQDRLCAASPGSPKPTRSPFALIEETIRKQQASGFALDPTLQRQFEAVGMIGSESESPMTSSIVNDNDLHKQETLQTYIPEPQPIVSVEAIATQGILKYEKEIEKYMKDNDGDEKDRDDHVEDDEDDEDEDDDYEHEHDKSVIDTDSIMVKSLSSNVENVRREATVLVDNVLEESIQFVNVQQDRDHIETYNAVVDNNVRAEYNSESENYAITCDDVDGLDVIKSPTIESMSGKSFDDNLSFTDEHIATVAGPSATTTTVTTYSVQQTQEQIQMLPQDGDEIFGTKFTTTQTSVAQVDDILEDRSTIRTRRVEHKFQKISSNVHDVDIEAAKFDEQFECVVPDDEISHLQGDFSKISWDDSQSPTTNTLGDIGQSTPDNDIQEIAAETKSTDITPVPPSSITTTLSQQSHDNADLGAPQGDVPKPKPRSVRISTPTEDVEEEKMSSQMPYEVEEQEVSFDLSDDVDNSVVPVPKPRSQMKTSDSFKNLDTLNQQQHHQPSQSDSISLRSFDYTEETSRTDDPSVSVSISMKSQQLDYPLTTTNTTTTTTSEDPATESIDPPSELSIDDGNVETERKTSFYIGESSRNIITKTTPTKLSVSEGAADEPLTAVMCREPIEATDISLMKEFSVDSDEENDVFKEYVTIKPTEPEAGTRIRRQSSETRNDLLEEDALTKETIESTTVVNTMTTTTTTTAGAVAEDGTLRKTSTEQSFTTTTITSTTSTSSAPLEVIHSTGEDDSVREISESMDIEIERPIDLDLPLEKSEWETTEKEIPPTGKGKIVHSPQQPILSDLTKEALTEEMVAKTLEEVQESLDAAKNELKSVIKDGKSIKESPSEFEFRSFSQTIASGSSEAEKISDMGIKTEKIIEETVELMEDEDISSFIGVPENIQDKHSQETENVITSTVIESLNREAAMLHYAQNIFEEKKPETSLGFVSTGTAESQDSHTSSDDHIVKEERASLGFISSETAEDFSSMEDYYQEKLAKADIVTEAKEEKEEVITSTAAGVDTFGEISSELTMKPFEDVVHRIKTESTDNAQNRWSVPEIDQSSSSESYYKSFEKSESRPLSSDIENLMTQANSSEYQTAADVSSVYRETTEFVSAVSTFESSSGKTISSHESMRSLDSQSETSANLGSIDVSELSETLVASSTEEADELQRLRDLADEEDSDDSLDLETMDYTVSESKIQQQSQMKRSQEMIFKPKSDDVSRKTEGEEDDQEKCIQTVQIKEYAKPKEVEKTWGLTYPIEDTKTDDFKDTDDILLYHGDIRRSIDDTKYASSLDEGSILSVSMSSTSNIDTVVENFEDIVGSVGASSLAGIEGFAASSLPEETTFVMEMDEGSGDFSPQNSTATTPPGETPTKRGHKRSESTSVPGDDIKNTPDKDTSAPQGEGKESESESDTDPYETEYARQFRSPSDRKSKKKKQAAAEMDHSFETEKRPFTPSQLVAEVIVEDSLTEELEAEECLLEERRPSQNMLNYSNIPDITVTEDIQPKSPILEEDTFEEKTLYKVKTQEELHKATDDRPLHEEKEMVIDLKEENFQKLVQEQYKQKLAELQKAEIGDSDYDYNKAPDSPDSFEMVDQPDISDEFVIIEEVAKEANEDDLGGKSIRIAPTKYESKHDEEVEKIIIKSAPADPKLGSQIFRDDLNFEFEESPPTGSSGGAGSEVQDESDSGPDMAANNKRWVEMQLTDNQLRYPYDLTGGVLEDIKEEDGEFEVGSSRISSFKDSFSSTPEYDVMAARRYYAARGEHDDISMSSLQEFESLEQAISLENRNRTHQGSTDSSNGSFQRRYILRNSASGPAQGDDISISSLKEFEGLENACIEAHLIEIKAKEEAAMLSRSDESNKSNGSDRDQILDPTKVVVSKVIRTVTHTEVLQSGQQPPDIETLLKQKLQECERAQSSIQITEISRTKADSDKGSIDSLEMNRSIDMVTSSVDDSFDISKDGTTKSDIDSLEVDKRQPTREESIESIEMEQMDDVMSKFGVTLGDGLTTTTTTTTTSTDADGHEHTTVTTRIITKTTLTGGGASSTSLDASAPEMMTKDFSAESLNQMSALDQTTTSSAGTTATYQTSAGNSQMSGSITSCASSTLMEDSAMSMSGLTMSSSYWSHEEETVKEGTDVKTKDTLNKEDHPPH
ncbi:serine-rich adhesin for platelets isoform X1 [Lucilia cuprina]|uniref:serine-rich adhesin for platelets isoform X1 n=1 Tax=Lucilia cuprina TaxID=7375 RepID=UPI001F055585|nr:serine-rich adhesin for platelets isoform X1 [Lucilia cuprina]